MRAYGRQIGIDWSRRRRRNPLVFEEVERRRLLSAFVVVTTADSGDGSLRQAITNADSTPGGNTITFDIPTSDPGYTPPAGGLPGYWTITPASALPAIARNPATPDVPNPLTIDGTSQPGYTGPTPIIQLNGINAGAGVDGLLITGGDCTVTGLAINQFQLNIVNGVRMGGSGIHLMGNGNNVIQGDYLGPDITAVNRVGNGRTGIEIDGSADNLIGGPGPGQGNIISSNRTDGIFIHDPGATGNVVQGNIIGTNTDSDTTGNLSNLLDGIEINGVSGNTVGGTSPGDGNVIARNNGNGVSIRGPNASDNVVQGNFIGTDTHGDGLLGNLVDGIYIDGADNNTIGGTTPGARNVIGLNAIGILVQPSVDNPNIPPIDASGNVIEGNYIGFTLDPVGTPIRLDNATDGIDLGGSGNTVGGTAPGAGNVISRNDGNGIDIIGRSLGGSAEHFGTQNVVEGNLIGTDPSGTISLPNAQDGILITDSANNTIGPGNTISGNDGDGVGILSSTSFGFPPSDNVVQGNLIGTNSTGSTALGNTGSGVNIVGVGNQSVSQNTIGGTTPLARNVISGNQGSGVSVIGAQATNNLIEGNEIGTDITGGNGIGNRQDGVLLTTGAAGNVVGGPGPGALNLIAANIGDGVSLTDGATGNLVQGDYIGVDATGAQPLGNLGDGVLIDSSFANTIGGAAAGDGNVITANQLNGVFLSGASAYFNQIQGNLIGVDSTGTRGTTAAGQPLGNVGYGISLSNAPNNTIGGTQSAERNIISANLLAGIQISGTAGGGNQVQGNSIGTDLSGTVALGNRLDGVLIDAAPSNVIGGPAPGAGNLIAGNQDAGVHLEGAGATSNFVQANTIGLAASGLSALPNATQGIQIDAAPNTFVGGPAAGLGNVISGNTGSGIQINGSGASGTLIAGNTIGTDPSGRVAVGNQADGIALNGAVQTLIGGAAAGAGNLVSGNGEDGIFVSNLTTAPAGVSGPLNTIQANRIGTDRGGDAALPNGNDGVDINGAILTLIGGTQSGARNLISGNASSGIEIAGSAATANQVEGNTIGTNQSGEAAVANSVGVYLNGAPNNTIGGTAAGAGNLISGNSQSGIQMLTFGASGNLVQGNVIGVDAADLVPLSNGVGVFISNVTGNTLGGSAPGASNTISGNFTAGVYIFGQSAAGNVVAGNIIGLDTRGLTPIALSNSTNADVAQVARQNVGVLINGAQSNTVGGTAPGSGNTISGNLVGVELSSFNANLPATTPPNLVLGNLIGTDRTGLVAQGNLYGVYINGLANNIIGAPGAGNVISGNSSVGVDLTGSLSTGNLIQSNLIGLGSDGKTAFRVGAHGYLQTIGVGIQNASKNTIGGTGAGQANLIAGNDQAGVYILGQANSAQGNVVIANTIGTRVPGGPSVGNRLYGVLKFNAANNTVVQSGKGANHFTANGIANVREYTGPVNTKNAGTKGTKVKLKIEQKATKGTKVVRAPAVRES